MMDREKQIEEMARMMCREKEHTCEECDSSDMCEFWTEASVLYKAGYRKQSEWINVDERLPDPNKLVLCLWERDGDGICYGFARYQREDVWYVSNEGMPCVTHWMPLPEPPKMKGGTE